MELEKTLINTKTKQEFYELMQILEDNGYEWNNGVAPTAGDYYTDSHTCIELYKGARIIFYRNSRFLWGERYNIISLSCFLYDNTDLVFRQGE